MGDILILTQEVDPTADFVVKELHRRGVEFTRFDVSEFPERASLTAFLDSISSDWNGRVERHRRNVSWGDVGSVWWRRPTAFRFPETLTRQERSFVRSEAAAAFGGLLRLQDALWMNHPEPTATAEFKPVQLKAARRHGLAIPSSLITNRIEDAKEFIERNTAAGSRSIYKVLSYADVVNPVNGQDEVIYTSVVTPADLDADLLAVAPCLFQEEVRKDLELRVTVVDDRLFAAGIRARAGSSAEVDFRADYTSLDYEQVELPAGLSERLLALVHGLGLRFAAIDMIRDVQGTYVFLELNPAGQWAWLEMELGLPIAAAIADVLCRGADDREAVASG